MEAPAATTRLIQPCLLDGGSYIRSLYLHNILIDYHQSNARFESAKAAALNGLPPDASLETRDLALAAFHKQWVLQESARQAQYTREWRRRCYEEIKLAARLRWHNFQVKIGMTPPEGLHDAQEKESKKQ